MMSSAALLLTSCAGGYQAPIDDRSSALERRSPQIIVDGRELSPSSSSSTATAAASVPAVASAPVGSTDTVVRTVNVGSGITRSITRSELPAAAEPATPTATAQTPAQQPRVQNTPPAPVQPTPEQAPVTSRPAATGSGTHIVAHGDTLYSIAFAHSVDVRTLALANNLAAPYTIYPGQRLNLNVRDISAAQISAVSQIPAAPAGESTPASGQRPQAAIDARRVGSVPTRQVEGVSWQWPAEGRLLSTFSETGATRGIDIGGTQGQSVYAAADGDVVYSGSGIQGAGNLLILRHSERHLSAYMHNRSMLVAEGDRVRAGDKIAEIGTGPNGRDLLHFEVRVDGKPVDPVRYLPNR